MKRLVMACVLNLQKGKVVERQSEYKLIRASEFIASGECPVSFYHVMHRNRQAFLESGAVVKVGNRWLVHPEGFFRTLAKLGQEQAAA